jgi:hypothetical protein
MYRVRAINFIPFLLMLSVVGLLGISACKKDDKQNTPAPAPVDPGNGGTPTDTTGQSTRAVVTATINGVAFTSDTVMYEALDTLHVYRATSGSRTVIISFGSQGIGSYPLGADNPSVRYVLPGIDFIPSFSDPGMLDITARDTAFVSGTFYANVQDIATTGSTASLTNGTFRHFPLP